MSHFTQITRLSNRRGVTLTEVLIAMGILAIGLLGVAAVFPVGGYYMQKGEVADRGGAIAQAALEDAIIRGHLNPENWIVNDATTGNGIFMKLVSGENGRTTPTVGMRQAVTNATTLRANLPGSAGNMIESDRSYVSTFYGGAYVIDPIGMAGALVGEDSTSGYQQAVQSITTSTPSRFFPGVSGSFTYNSPMWAPWDAQGLFWPVRRVTTASQLNALSRPDTYNKQETIARDLFASKDDLALSLPDSGDTPVRQQWQTWSDGSNSTAPGFAAARQSAGDYSWIISVSPGSSVARNALATNPDAYPVEVSVVVFYKRLAARGPQLTAEAERLVNARVVSTNPGGGELLLTRRMDGVDLSPFEDVRPGQYVMVTGPHPMSTLQRPMLAIRWCRVLGIEDTGRHRLRDGSEVVLDSERQILVAFRGPDWPWADTFPLEIGSDPTLAGPSQILANDLRVAILPGAVAVHTKTMRLESGTQWAID